MQNLINFKKSEVVASNKEEAFDQVSFKIIGDATQAYKNWVQKQTHTITEPMLKEFYIEQLKKKTKLIEGVVWLFVLKLLLRILVKDLIRLKM